MTVKNGFISRDIGGNHMVIAVGERAKKFKAIIHLNESGLLLWNTLSRGAEREELILALLEEYDVSREIAEKDVDDFLSTLQSADILEN